MTKPTIAIIGGTGQQGSGLAGRFAKAGYKVVLGSRDGAKAAAVAATLNAKVGNGLVTAADSRTAAQQADIAILTVPFAHQRAMGLEIADAVRGRILVDATVPLLPIDIGRVQFPNGASAVAGLQAILPDVKVVAAFQNVSHVQLQDLDHKVEGDIFVCGNDTAACDTVIDLISAMGMRGFHGGPVENAAAAEALTAVLISISRKYRTPAIGVRLVTLDEG